MDTLPKVLELAFPELKLTYNKAELIVKFANGSEIFFFGLDDKRSERILGMEFSTIFYDEISELSFRSIQKANTRLAEKNALKNKAFYAMNPPAKSHWSYWYFIKKLDPNDNTKLNNADEIGTLLMNPKDNVANIDEDYIKMLENMPEKDRIRFLEGKFSENDDGQAYYAFNYEKNVCETITDNMGTFVVPMDFNVNPMTALVCQVFNNKIHVQKEIFLPNSNTFKMCLELKRLGLTGASIVPDSTGKNRKTSGKSDFQIINENGFHIEKTFNPLQRDRVNNLNYMLHNEQIVINPSCRKLINDLEKVSMIGNNLDKSDDQLTHLSDCLGYICWWHKPLVSNSEIKIYNY